MFVSGSSKDDDSNASGLAGHQSVPLSSFKFKYSVQYQLFIETSFKYSRKA